MNSGYKAVNTTQTRIMYKVHRKMTVQVHLNLVYARKESFANTGTGTFRLGYFCCGIAFLARICISPTDHFLLMGSLCDPLGGFGHLQADPVCVSPID